MTDASTDKPSTILIVEDEALVARDIQSRLQNLGYVVAGLAHNPKQAIRLAEELRPGLLLCDIHLKDEIDGIDVAKAITEKLDIPVIFLTAYSDKETVAKAKSVTPYGYVLKPIETAALQIAIEMALHKFSIEQELRETRQLLANALHCIGDALVFVDAQGQISNINSEAEQLFGSSAKQVAGTDWRQLFQLDLHPADRSARQFLETALRAEAVTRLPPFSLVIADGSQILLDGIVGPTIKKGEPNGAVMMLRELAELHDPVEKLSRPETDSALIFQSSNMAGVMEHVRLVAPTDATVLITGESGTGKELISREIHRLSNRSDKPLVIVDCGAIVGNLIESELFGHVKGAFTGADSAKVGKLKEADGGTILLDEIGELAIEVQAKLLRAVQEMQFTAVGSNQFQKVDIRIIAATNVDLEASIRAGSFREDLYYRLNVFTIHSPALRDRREDILPLARHFLQTCSRQYKKNIVGFTVEAEQAMQQYHWPGNIRELRNRLIRAVILCQGTQIGQPQLELPGATAMPDYVTGTESPSPQPAKEHRPEKLGPVEIEQALQLALAAEVRHCLHEGRLLPLGDWLQEDLIQTSLELHQHINLRAAEALGMPESTLRRKAARYTLTAETSPSRSPGWAAVAGLLPQWIQAEGRARADSQRRLHNLLISQIKEHSQVQSDAAMLAGVSAPTYRRQLRELQALEKI